MEEIAGILVLNKPKGWTSHDCVAKIRNLSGVKKVGHTGTLDPEVTGVLPICLGRATKLVQYMTEQKKEYMAELTLGVATTTEDQTGQVIEDKPVDKPPPAEQIEQTMQRFRGPIEQTPPLYSAVKVKGKRLYEWAREGVEVERPIRQVFIYELELLEYQPIPPHPLIRFRVLCSKGTYVRTLGVDIGRELGYPAHLSKLVRTRSGPYHLEEAYSMEDVSAWSRSDWLTRLLPLDSALEDFPEICLDWDHVERLIHGQPVQTKCILSTDQLYRVYDPTGRFIAIALGSQPNNLLIPKKVLLT